MLRVLIVDDEALLRALVCEILSVIPVVSFLEAEDGIAAFEQARLCQPKLIISDIRLPKMNGFELCHAIKHDPVLVSIPVILITASTVPEDETIAKAVRADGFLRKPFEEPELLEMASKMLYGSMS